jgi:hypothetical protein
MKIISEECTSYRVAKDFDLELDDGTVLNFSKWVYEDDCENDSDYEFNKEDKKTFDELPEEEQEKIIDFINEIKI